MRRKSDQTCAAVTVINNVNATGLNTLISFLFLQTTHQVSRRQRQLWFCNYIERWSSMRLQLVHVGGKKLRGHWNSLLCNEREKAMISNTSARLDARVKRGQISQELKSLLLSVSRRQFFITSPYHKFGFTMLL